jgi:hypothetical protein
MFIFFSKKIHLPSFITSSVKTTIVALAFISLGVNIANIVDSADSVNSRSHGLYGSKSADCYATVPVMFFLLLASNSVTLKSTFTIPFMLFSRTIRNCNLSCVTCNNFSLDITSTHMSTNKARELLAAVDTDGHDNVLLHLCADKVWTHCHSVLLFPQGLFPTVLDEGVHQ